MAKLYSVIFTVLFFTTTCVAQVTGYTFSQSTGTYTPVTGTVIQAAGWDDNVSSVALPFTFNFNGIAYTSVSINTNGYITFGTTTSSGSFYSPISATVAYGGVVAAFANDIIGNVSGIEAATTGTAPNRVFVLQWKNVLRVFNTNVVAGDNFNFQIRLREGGGSAANQSVQVVYGNCTTASALSITQQVGLRGATNSDYNNRTTSFNWSATTAGTINTASCTATNTVLPANGLTFTWTPAQVCVTPANQPTALELTPFSGSQVNGSFVAAASAPNGYLVVRYMAGAAPTNPVNGTAYTAGSALGSGTVVKANSASTFTATGLLARTAYDFYVYAYNSGCAGGPVYRTTGALSGSITTPEPAITQCTGGYMPANGTAGLPVNTVLTWDGVNAVPAVTGYNVYLSTNSALVSAEDTAVRVAANQSGTSYTLPQPLNYNTTYYWKTVPINAYGPAAGCPVNSFSSYVSTTITSKPGGGLWSSAATWQGGAIPIAGDDVVIADSAVVTVDVAVSGIRNLTIGQGLSGVLQWGAANNALTLFGNLTVSNGARFLPISTTIVGQVINIGGNFTNNGYANLATAFAEVNMNGSLQAGGSAEQILGGTGIFEGNATQGIINSLHFRNTGNCFITTSSNLIVTSNFTHAAGTLNTNGKLTIDNTAQVFGQPLTTQVAGAVVTNMGGGFLSTPIVFSNKVDPWLAGSTGNAGFFYYAGNRVYICTTTGTFSASTAPTHTTGTAVNGTASLLWLAPLGTIGNPFKPGVVASFGTQYFYGGNLYTCTTPGLPGAANPPVHISGTVFSGGAAYRYVGSTAIVTANYDAVTQTIRSLNLVSTGSGYNSAPVIVITDTGITATITATAVALLNRATSSQQNNSLVQKSGSAIITGGLSINSTQGAVSQSGVGSMLASYGGVNYTVAPVVGFTGPNGINLLTAGGSGYTGTPGIVVTGGTLVAGTALTTAAFTITVNRGKVISVYLNAGSNAMYSVPPTLSFSGGGGTGATLAFPAGCWPAATAIIGINGQLSNFTITNAGYGYTAAPSAGVGTSSGTVLGGTFADAAATFSTKAALYNLTINTFAPATTSVPNPDDAVIPANRKINTLTLGAITTGTGSLNLTGNLEVFSLTGLIINKGVLDMGGNTLLCSSPSYTGAPGSATAYITNGAINLSSRGGGTSGAFLDFAYETNFRLFTGSSAAVTEGSTITSITVSRTAAPTGLNAIGTRAYRMVTNSGAVLGTDPVVTMNWNGADSLVSDNPTLRISQSGALSGPWIVKSATTGTGTIAATGSRSTALISAGPISISGNDYFAWTTNYVPPPALAYTVSRTTGNAYQSIAPVTAGGDGSGLLSTAGSDETAQVSINVASAGFVYQGSPVTAMSIHPNGYIVLNNGYSTYSSSNSWNNSLSASNNGNPTGGFDAFKRNVIAPFYDDLSKGNPVIYYKVTGTKVIVEWLNTTLFGTTGAQLNFQAVLDGADQSIRFNYGNMQSYNGSQNVRYSYTCGINGGFVAQTAQAGQVMQQQFENTTFFTHENNSNANWGANGLSISPEPRSSIKFMPGAYIPITPPAASAPVNDDPSGAILRSSVTAFPANIAWDNATNTSNLFTTRFATNTAVPATCGGPSNAKDVWFKFVAPNPSVTVRIYGSGGFIPRVSLYDTSLAPLPNCTAGGQGLTATTTAAGLTVGKTYFVRVYHDSTGSQATATAAVTNGIVTGLNITPGTNYSVPTAISTYFPSNLGPRISFSGGGGTGAAAAFTTPATAATTQTLTANNISFTGGSGYTSPPTVTIESPDWGITGEFGIVLFSVAENDECAGAITLTNLDNSGCITGQNSATTFTKHATASPEAAACGVPDDDLWYKFTATTAVTYVKVEGTGTFNPGLQVFNGGAGAGSCAAKTNLSCANTIGASGVFTGITTTIGNTYFVRVYHYGAGSAMGDSFNICVSSARPPCTAAPITPVNGAGRCPGPVLLSWQRTFNTSTYDLYLDAGAGPASTLVYSGVDTSFTTSNLAPGIYTWRVEPKNLIGAAAGCSNFNFTVNAPPTVTVLPAGQVTICTPATQVLSAGATNAASPGYQWVNGTTNIIGATASEIIVASAGNYRLVITDGITGCRDTSAATMVSVSNPPPVTIFPAAATVSCDTVKLSVAGGNAPIKITEITLFRTGTGQTASYPAYMGTADGDFLEISNISGAPVNAGGYSIADYSSNSSAAVHPYTIPAGTIIPANGIMVIHLGTGTDDPVNLYFNTGGLSASYSSAAQVGFVIKNAAGNVADAVGCGGSAGSYTFAPATGVTASDWSGFAANAAGFAGLIRSLAVDNNKGSDWVASGTPTPLQTIGTYNSGYVLPVYTWLPASGLYMDAALTIPYASQNAATVYAQPGITTTYNLQATGVVCPGNNTVTITVLPPAVIEWLGTVNTDWTNARNWKCGIIPTITTDVIINGGAPNYPLVTLNVEVKSLTVKPGAVVNVAAGFEIKLNGN
jgi:hypothetical protein